MRFNVKVMRPKQPANSITQRFFGQQPPLEDHVAFFNIPCELADTFDVVWQKAQAAFDKGYGKAKAHDTYFSKIQDAQGADIFANDKVGSLYQESSDPSAQPPLLVIVQQPLDRDSSIPAGSSLRPKGFKKRALTTEEESIFKRRKLHVERYGAPLDEVGADVPLISRESRVPGELEHGGDRRATQTPRVDADGFTIPALPRPIDQSHGRSSLQPRQQQHVQVLVQDSQAGTTGLQRTAMRAQTAAAALQERMQTSLQNQRSAQSVSRDRPRSAQRDGQLQRATVAPRSVSHAPSRQSAASPHRSASAVPNQGQTSASCQLQVSTAGVPRRETNGALLTPESRRDSSNEAPTSAQRPRPSPALLSERAHRFVQRPAAPAAELATDMNVVDPIQDIDDVLLGGIGDQEMMDAGQDYEMHGALDGDEQPELPRGRSRSRSLDSARDFVRDARPESSQLLPTGTVPISVTTPVDQNGLLLSSNAFDVLASSQAKQVSSDRTPSASTHWTEEEDNLLIKGMKAGLNVPQTLRKYKINRSEGAGRSRKKALKDKDPSIALFKIKPGGASKSEPARGSEPTPTSEPVSTSEPGEPTPVREPIPAREPAPTSEPALQSGNPELSDDEMTIDTPVNQRIYWHQDDIGKLRKGIADGFDALEIQAVYFPNTTEEAIKKKIQKTGLDVIVWNSEQNKPDFPRDDLVVDGWTVKDSLRLRRGFREGLKRSTLQRRWLSKFNYEVVKQKMSAYIRQMERLESGEPQTSQTLAVPTTDGPTSEDAHVEITNDTTADATAMDTAEDVMDPVVETNNNAGPEVTVSNFPPSRPRTRSQTDAVVNSSPPDLQQDGARVSPVVVVAEDDEDEEDDEDDVEDSPQGQLRRGNGNGGQTTINYKRKKGKGLAGPPPPSRAELDTQYTRAGTLRSGLTRTVEEPAEEAVENVSGQHESEDEDDEVTDIDRLEKQLDEDSLQSQLDSQLLPKALDGANDEDDPQVPSTPVHKPLSSHSQSQQPLRRSPRRPAPSVSQSQQAVQPSPRRPVRLTNSMSTTQWEYEARMSVPQNGGLETQGVVEDFIKQTAEPLTVPPASAEHQGRKPEILDSNGDAETQSVEDSFPQAAQLPAPATLPEEDDDDESQAFQTQDPSTTLSQRTRPGRLQPIIRPGSYVEEVRRVEIAVEEAVQPRRSHHRAPIPVSDDEESDVEPKRNYLIQTDQEMWADAKRRARNPAEAQEIYEDLEHNRFFWKAHSAGDNDEIKRLHQVHLQREQRRAKEQGVDLRIEQIEAMEEEEKYADMVDDRVWTDEEEDLDRERHFSEVEEDDADGLPSLRICEAPQEEQIQYEYVEDDGGEDDDGMEASVVESQQEKKKRSKKHRKKSGQTSAAQPDSLDSTTMPPPAQRPQHSNTLRRMTSSESNVSAGTSNSSLRKRQARRKRSAQNRRESASEQSESVIAEPPTPVVPRAGIRDMLRMNVSIPDPPRFRPKPSPRRYVLPNDDEYDSSSEEESDEE